MKSPTCLLCVVVTAVTASRGARSEPQAGPAATTTPNSESQADAHYKQGKAFLDAKVYDQAIREFTASYALDPLPELLFDLGQAYRLSGQIDPALDAYQKFVAAVPDGSLADEARVHIAELTKTRIDQQRAAAAAAQQAALARQQAAIAQRQAVLAQRQATYASWKQRHDEAAHHRQVGWLLAGLGLAVGVPGVIYDNGGLIGSGLVGVVIGLPFLIGGYVDDPGPPPALSTALSKGDQKFVLSHAWRF